ncbi:hypothetical protein ACJRO7_013491 [Eucalyptus globulus]|uniref:Uncharacterized protein n=1 Tax=Eucalyptus globulus TaxID=34317 RepID=A0ABD3KY41_EUCGL
MARANLKCSWTILLMLILAFGLAPLPTTKARDLGGQGHAGVEEEGEAGRSLYQILHDVPSGPNPIESPPSIGEEGEATHFHYQILRDAPGGPDPGHH